MKTVVITGSARGLGFEMAKLFRKANLNVVISDLKEDNLRIAKEQLDKLEGTGKVEYKVCNVTNSKDIQELIDFTDKEFNTIDIWINNAGVNQPDKPIWELTEQEIDLVLDVDLKGAVIGSKLALEYMTKQGHGAQSLCVLYGYEQR